MAKQAKIVLVRHGTTDLNEQGVIRGWSNIELNKAGHKIAQHTAEMVKDEWPQAQKLYSSDLSRAQESAHYIHMELDLPILLSKNLRPWNVGDLTGKQVPNIGKILEYYATHLDKAPENGESMRTFLSRLLDFMTEVISDAEDGDSPIILVTSIRPIETTIGWIEANMVSKNIHMDRLIVPKDTINPGGIVELSGSLKDPWSYEIIYDGMEEGEEEFKDDSQVASSHAPNGVFGYYRKGGLS